MEKIILNQLELQALEKLTEKSREKLCGTDLCDTVTEEMQMLVQERECVLDTLFFTTVRIRKWIDFILDATKEKLEYNEKNGIWHLSQNDYEISTDIVNFLVLILENKAVLNVWLDETADLLVRLKEETGDV